MSRMSNRRKSSLKDIIKPLPTIKEPKNGMTVEFRWSTTVIQYGLLDDPYILKFEFDDTQQKTNFSPASSTTRNSANSPTVYSNEKHSFHLPSIHMNKKPKLLSSSNENSSQYLPLIIPYSQLNHPKKILPPKIKTQPHHRSRQTLLDTDLSLSSKSTSPTSDKYIRLPASQLRRLNVSNKYLKEAKKLYFNAASKVFVPRRPLMEIAQ